MGGSRPNIAICWRRNRRPVRCERADRAGTSRFGLRAGAGAWRGGGRSFPDTEQRAPAAKGRARPGGGETGSQSGPGLAVLPPRRYARSRRSRSRTPQAGTQRSACIALTLSTSSRARCLPTSCMPDTAASALSSTTTQRGFHLQMARCRSRRRRCRGRHPLRRCDLRFSAISTRSSRGRSPTVAYWRTNAFRIGRRTAWLMWLGQSKHFLTFPVRAGSSSTTSASCRQTRR